MRKLVLLVAAVGVTCHFIGAANAKDHLQQISKDSAAALCKNHGGGTECDFCQGNLCHTVICGTKSCVTWLPPGGSFGQTNRWRSAALRNTQPVPPPILEPRAAANRTLANTLAVVAGGTSRSLTRRP